MQQHWRDQPRHRHPRIDVWPLAVSDGASSAAGDSDGADSERTRTPGDMRVTASPPALIGDDPRCSLITDTNHHTCLYAASECPTSTSAVLSSAQPTTSLSPLCPSVRRASCDNKMTLTLRSIRFWVVRGDYGRRCSFVMRPKFECTWNCSTAYCKVGDGKQAEVEVQETVRCQVIASSGTHNNRATATPPTTTLNKIAPQATASRTASSSAGAVKISGGLPSLLYHNEESSSPAVTPNVAEDILVDGYFYEATQITRRHSIPTCSTNLRVNPYSLAGCSSALFADCLIRCALDEAAIALDDRRGWVHLYCGHHITSEVGRTRLLNDVFELDNLGATPSTARSSGEMPSLTICLFRKC
ncbi:hypothetical protein JKF63_01142 [Porcisia hertigi]|uniref:Uncharacterized protein n=1 Tax=Porcisia hertigi TaxID=2761500 RepID=A0A836L9M4_9TRYP|nr:hypothetical protein JKF63_01142 [Porcisia hertigi]